MGGKQQPIECVLRNGSWQKLTSDIAPTEDSPVDGIPLIAAEWSRHSKRIENRLHEGPYPSNSAGLPTFRAGLPMLPGRSSDFGFIWCSPFPALTASGNCCAIHLTALGTSRTCTAFPIIQTREV